MTQADLDLSEIERRDFRRLAGIMLPASAEFAVPGADDAQIFADIAASLGRDRAAVGEALALLAEIAGGSFADLEQAQAESVAMALLCQDRPCIQALGRAVLQCYYRDDRVVRALGREPRPPFPLGHPMEPTDWSVLEPQKDRPRMWRDLDGYGA